MPRITATAIPEEILRKALPGMLDAMLVLLDCPREAFTVELFPTVAITPSPWPFIQVAWFDRGQDLQDQLARIITEHLKVAGSQPPDVVFLRLERSAYYEDGTHF